MRDLKEQFRSLLSQAVRKAEFVVLYQDKDGKLVYTVFDMSYEQFLRETMRIRLEQAMELIVGTKTGDAYVCGYWKKGNRAHVAAVGEGWEFGLFALQDDEISDWRKDDEICKQLRCDLEDSDAIILGSAAVLMEKHSVSVDSRPDDIDAAELAEWGDGFEDWKRSNDPPPITDNKSNDFFRELFYSGQWLRRELEKLTDDDNLIESQQSVVGQRAFLNNPWTAAKAVLANFKDGIIESPGAALADTIMRECIAVGKISIEGGKVSFNV